MGSEMCIRDRERYIPYDSSRGDVPEMADYFTGYRWHTTGLNHDATGFPTTNPQVCNREEIRMISKVVDHVDEIENFEEFMIDDADICVVAFGSTARAAAVAVSDARARGIKAGMLRLITLWPFPERKMRELASQTDKGVIVPEANLGQLIYEVERLVSGKCPVVGVNKVGGVPIYPGEVLSKIEELA